MQSNVDCIMDELNQFPDSWVELYNTTDAPVALKDWTVGLTANAANSEELPNTTIPAHGYYMVYCDKEAMGRHMSFRLESGNGCSFYLFHNGVQVDAVVNLGKQPAPNIAYGRASDGGSSWGYMLQPTPMAANTGCTTHSILPSPVVETPGQVFTTGSSVNIKLSLPATAPAGTIIRYTTDGTEPTLTNGMTFNPAYTLVMNKTTVLRAKLFCDGYISPRALTHTYIFLNRAMQMPVISIAIDPAFLTDPKKGIYVDGNYSSQKKNYEYDWWRPINFELFDEPSHASKLNQVCKTRVQGGASRGTALKSLIIDSHKRFGEKRLRYEFFPDQRPGVTDYKSIILRNAGNDFDYLYMRDGIMQRSMGQYVDLDWQAWRPAIVYINGVYKGILNIRERSTKDLVYTHYDGLEDITMIKNMGEVLEGDWNLWNNFKTFYAGYDHTWSEYEQQLDCIEYINLMILNLFYNNQDFPGNNIVFWRPNHAEPGLPARWRVVAKDTDFGLGLYDNPASYETFRWFYNNNYDPNHAWANSADATRLFRRAMDNADFQREFVDRSCIYIGDFLNYRTVWPMWEQMYNQIKDEWQYHRPLYNQWWPNYSQELSKAKKWLQDRPTYYLYQLTQQYNLGAQCTIDVNRQCPEETAEQLRLTMCGVAISKSTWSGSFFKNRQVTLNCTPKSGSPLTVVGWNVTIDGVMQRYNGATCTVTIPNSCANMTAEVVVENTTDLEQMAWEESVVKQYENGQIVIMRNGKKYSILGNLINQ